MKAFQIPTPREVKLTDVEVLSKKDREPGEAPGIKLSVFGDFPGATLEQFVPGLQEDLFKVGEAAAMGSDTTLTDLTDLAKFLGTIVPTDEFTGYSGTIDFGTGKASGIPFEAAKIHGFRIDCKEGGSVQIKLQIDIPNMAEKTLGKIAIHKSQKMELTLVAPTVVPDKKPDAEQLGLLNADTPPVGGRPPNPFDKKGEADVSDAEVKPTGDGNPFDTPETALANSLGVQ